MLNLEQFAAAMSSYESAVWGRVVAQSSRQLEVLAVAGSKDCFVNSRDPDGTPWKPLAHPRPNGGGKVLRDKGLLAASVSASVTEQGIRLTASHPGANLHQFGGTVKPKRGKFLAIPVSKEGKREGRPRNFPRPLFVSGAAGGNLVLAESTGKGKRAKLTVHYVLTKSVTVPARPFVGFGPDTVSKMIRLLGDNFRDAVLAEMEGRKLAHFAANPLIG